MAKLARIAGGCGALVLAAACALPPEGVSQQQMASFDQAVASVGCQLRTEREYLAVELQTGMTREQAMQMGQVRLASGAAQQIEGGGIRLTSGPCAA